MSLKGNVLITGGAGYLGRAIVRRAINENWDCSFSILSRDPEKHHKMQIEFPKCRYIIGDICDLNGLSKAFAGHDIVIHAGAQKHIPDGENNVSETIRVNVGGSENVARAAIIAQVDKVVGISTDKVCHPVNVYGATKMLMERLFQEYDRKGLTQFHLVRYGNVLGSTGSVIPVWQKMLERDGYVTATDPEMSRFWMSIEQAVDAVLMSLTRQHGTITVPKCKSLSMKLFSEYTMPGVKFVYTGLRPGEKRHEELTTKEEVHFVNEMLDWFDVYPVTSKAFEFPAYFTDMVNESYSSDNAKQLTKEELLEMLK